ncbi:MAG TPA: radical SAM protein [Candidatus Xenobia bacterium]
MTWNLIQKAQRLVASETNLFPPTRGGDVLFALCYPNTYFVGMSNLGLHAIYGYLNRKPGIVCERAFLPDPDDLDEVRKKSGSLFSLESQRPLQEFDIVGLSISYELDFVNVLRILDMAGLPLRTAERDERHPLVIAGGAIGFLNPDPLSDFIDAFVVGEGEEAAVAVVETFREHRGRSRGELLEALARLPGVFVPSLYRQTYDERGRLLSFEPTGPASASVERLAVPKLDFVTHSAILTEHTEFRRSFLLEISRGCPYMCRFCVVGYVYTPNRWRDLELLWEAAQIGLKHTDRFGMLGAVVNVYPKMPELVRRLLSHGAKSIAFASMRADSLKDEIIEAIAASGQETLTLAPETGDEGLRFFINKRMKDDALVRALERGLKGGVRNFRLYFMAGVPKETEQNVDDSIRIIRDCLKLIRPAGAGLQVSMSQFVPKGGTPFQWYAPDRQSVIEGKMARVRAALGHEKGLDLHLESPRWCTIQALLARADRRIGPVLAEVVWNNTTTAWKRACAKHGLDLEDLMYRDRPVDEVQPWSVVQTPTLHARLVKEREQGESRMTALLAERATRHDQSLEAAAEADAAVANVR